MAKIWKLRWERIRNKKNKNKNRKKEIKDKKRRKIENKIGIR